MSREQPVASIVDISDGRRGGIIERTILRLRTAIMDGQLKPGQKLIETDLCRELSISRGSMRDAFRALEAERLVELIPNRGPFVAKLGETDVQGIHDVWALLTGEMVAQFTPLATLHDIARLETCIKRLRVAVKEKNIILQLSATNAFFNCISTHCGNRVLYDTVVRLVARINFLRTQSLQLEGWPSVCADEIADVLAAIRQKRPALARAAVQRHISSACAAAKQVIVFHRSEPFSGVQAAGRQS